MFIPELLIFVLAFLFYAGGILVHVLAILKVIPFNLINGGRSENYEAQAKTSKVSIAILLIGILYVVSGLIFPSFKRNIIFMIFAFILSFLWLVGTIMQLLGTKFERYYLSWLNLIGVVSHIGLAILYFADSE